MSETFLKPCDVFRIPNYFCYRADRHTSRCGGVAILIKKDISHTASGRLDLDHVENISVTVDMANGSSLRVFSCYIPPSKPLTVEDLDRLFTSSDKLIVGGDLNSKNSAWNSRVNNAKGRRLLLHSLQNDYVITAPVEPTHYSAIGIDARGDVLDVFCLRNVNFMYSVHSLTELSSDHNPVLLELEGWQDHQVLSTRRKTNWRRYRECLNSIIRPVPEISSVDELETEIQKVTDEILHARGTSTITSSLAVGFNDIPYVGEPVTRCLLKTNVRQIVS